MPITRQPIPSAEDYLDLVKSLASLLDRQFETWEAMAKDDKRLNQLATQMPAIISLVNSIGYLRGQDGVFLDIRPSLPSGQKELYGYEEYFEHKLQNLINRLLDSPSG
ncbi:MAG TPA: hypothetical protein ENN77_02185, partial [Candidatus Wirthbacteria bacterium]|nr:hypothetical protein [Candidatus Wirthbacteria bacterium]